MMEYGHWRLNSWLVRTLIDESGPTVDWLEELGVQFDLMEEFARNNPHIVFPFRVEGGKAGLGIMKVLIKQCEDRGIDILCNTRARNMTRSNDGTSVTVLADKGGGGNEGLGKESGPGHGWFCGQQGHAEKIHSTL